MTLYYIKLQLLEINNCTVNCICKKYCKGNITISMAIMMPESETISIFPPMLHYVLLPLHFI